jgi:hypothetical protein
VAWLSLSDRIERYDKKSGSNQFWYKWIKLAQLMLAAFILVLSLVEVPWWRWITAVLGGLIVVLEGFNNFSSSMICGLAIAAPPSN